MTGTYDGTPGNRMPGGPGLAYWQGRDGRYDMRGENARSAKLTTAQVAEIKAAPREGAERISNLALARHYGVNATTIRTIRGGGTWNHVAAGTWPPASWVEHTQDFRLKGSP